MASPLTRYCPSCYATNPWVESECASCGAALETEESFDERLIWSLRHPDTGTAVLAAEVLARRRAALAIPALIELSRSADPFRAAAARALQAFEPDRRAHAALDSLRDNGSVLVRSAVSHTERRA
jgi:hypothetical protein